MASERARRTPDVKPAVVAEVSATSGSPAFVAFARLASGRLSTRQIEAARPIVASIATGEPIRRSDLDAFIGAGAMSPPFSQTSKLKLALDQLAAVGLRVPPGAYADAERGSRLLGNQKQR